MMKNLLSKLGMTTDHVILLVFTGLIVYFIMYNGFCYVKENFSDFVPLTGDQLKQKNPIISIHDNPQVTESLKDHKDDCKCDNCFDEGCCKDQPTNDTDKKACDCHSCNGGCNYRVISYGTPGIDTTKIKVNRQ